MSAPDLTITGVDLVFRRRINAWVIVFGPDSVYHLSQPTGSRWQVRRPYALEPLFVERSMVDCVRQLKEYEQRRAAESKRRIDLILSEPTVRAALSRAMR
jgi:hypothetical protein